MIYFIKPKNDNSSIWRFLKQIFKKHYPNETVLEQEHTQIQKSPNNVYFIINLQENNQYDGIKAAKNIRTEDSYGHIILLTDTLDYTRFFRSYVGFLGVINFKNYTLREIQEYLGFALKKQDNTSLSSV